MPVEVARAHLGAVADMVEWHVSDDQLPSFLHERLDPTLAEGVACYGWFAVLRELGPRNTGIRGLPPGYDLRAALERVQLWPDCVLPSGWLLRDQVTRIEPAGLPLASKVCRRSSAM